MTKPNTTEDIQTRLDEIEGRRAKATAGPYTTKPQEPLTEGPAKGMSPSVVIAATAASKSNRIYATPLGGTYPAADQEFFAHSWTDIGYLTEVCRGLLEENATLESTVDMLGHPVDSPCGHSSIYAVSDDGGANIRCLVCRETRLLEDRNRFQALHSNDTEALQREIERLPNESKNLRQENVEVLEKAIGAVQSISAGSPETLQEVIRVLRTQQEET